LPRAPSSPTCNTASEVTSSQKYNTNVESKRIKKQSVVSKIFISAKGSETTDDDDLQSVRKNRRIKQNKIGMTLGLKTIYPLNKHLIFIFYFFK